MVKMRSREEEVVWLRGYDKELREQLLYWDASELETYEDFLYAQIESRELELQESMGRVS
jgi:hypothetical protein